MKSKHVLNKGKEKYKLVNSKNKLKKLKSDFFLRKFFEYVPNKKSLEIMKYNRNIQKRMNINIKNYKDYSEKYSSIEIEIIPIKNKYGEFIKIVEKEDEKYYHIYFNNSKKEIKKTTIKRKDKVAKIKIIIDYQVKSFEKLFSDCFCIESINFKKFYRNNINNMSEMFEYCLLKELNLSNFSTNNVTNMKAMFCCCSSLEKLNVTNFNTNKVADMSFMFKGCLSLKELNVSNFNTAKVKNMRYMFHNCQTLKELNLSNFNTNKVTDLSWMFGECLSLNELNISNFNFHNVTDMSDMFYKCLYKLKTKIHKQFKNMKKEALYEFDFYKLKLNYI